MPGEAGGYPPELLNPDPLSTYGRSNAPGAGPVDLVQANPATGDIIQRQANGQWQNAPPGEGLAGTQVKQLSSTGGYAFAVYSKSEVEHAFTANMAATGGNASAGNFVSSNTNFSCVQISGVENNKGTLKISHTNKSGSASGDANAAMVSLETHNGTETASAVQGIAIKFAEGATGAVLTVRDFEANLLLRIKASMVTEQKEAAAPPTVEGGCWALYVEGGKLFLKLGAAAAKEITVP